MRNLSSLLSVVFFLFLTFGVLFGQTSNSYGSKGIFDLLVSDGPREITVKSDFSYLVTNKKTAEDYVDGSFSFEPSKGVTKTLPVKVKCRGRYRRMKCDFPPLKLKFKKDDLAAHDYNDFNELKLVTHCMDEKERSKDLIVRECLAYKLFNIINPHSLRAQIVKVDYINTKGKPSKFKGWGILTEDPDELVHRMGGRKYQHMGIPVDSFNLHQEQVTALFNFMIGNTDWSCLMARNVELVLTPDGVIPVPYDFDFSGMVAAPYATINPNLGQKTLKDRAYLGHPCHPDNMQAAIDLYLSKKKEILKAVADERLLMPESKKDITDYLESFFELLLDKEKLAVAIAPKG